jgi:hypothetical protein
VAKTATKSIRQKLVEQSFSTQPEVDRDAGVIRNVKVLGTISRNGREYSEAAKRDAVKVLEGATVNIDHNRDNPKKERGFMESVGTLHGLENRPDGVYASEFRVKKSHPCAPVIFESAERFPKDFGLSINAEGEVAKRGGKWVVESLVSAQSVDVVGKPATTDGLFESLNSPEKGRTVVKRTIKQLLEQHGTADQKGRLARLLETSSSDAAAVGQPVDVPPMSTDPEYDGDDGDDNSLALDPMDQINGAFAALVMNVMANDALDLKGKIAQITTLLKTQDQLLKGTVLSTKVEEAEQSGDDGNATGADSSGGAGNSGGDMMESLKPLQTAITQILESQRRSDARISLIEAAVEPTGERVMALVEAADEATRQKLIESWPARRAQKPALSKPLFESSNSPMQYPSDTKSFASFVK